LRQRREQQKRTVAELATETCITSRYLEAIEADEPSRLPGFFFYRNYVKQYARALGLDGVQMYHELAAAAPAEEADLLAALSTSYTPKRTPVVRAAARWWMRFAAASLVLIAASAGFTVAARARESHAPVAAVVAAPTHP
jgi:cytoskeletal protein RodZ